MKKNCEKINWKILNLSFWIEIILSYLLPFQITDGSRYKVGFPIPFIFMDPTRFHTSPFMSMHVNPLGLLLNVILIYLMIIFCIKIYQKIRHKNIK